VDDADVSAKQLADIEPIKRKRPTAGHAKQDQNAARGRAENGVIDALQMLALTSIGLQPSR